MDLGGKIRKVCNDIDHRKLIHYEPLFFYQLGGTSMGIRYERSGTKIFVPVLV